MISPWPSTYISRGPWNSCSGFPPKPQPLSPYVVLKGESHHQWPWGLHPQPGKQKIPLGRGDRLSHPSSNGNPHADASVGGHARWHPQPPSYHSPPAAAHCAEDTRGSQYVHSPLQDHTCCPAIKTSSTTGENEHNPRATAHCQILQGSLLQRAGLRCRTCNSSEWSPDHWSCYTGQCVWHICSLYPPTGTQRECPSTGVPGKRREGRLAKLLWRPSGAAIVACLPENWGTLLYPLQLLTGNVPLATLLGMSATTQLQAVADRGPTPATSNPGVLGAPALLIGANCWHHS